MLGSAGLVRQTRDIASAVLEIRWGHDDQDPYIHTVAKYVGNGLNDASKKKEKKLKNEYFSKSFVKTAY
jgi:hypothetical protein